MHNFVFNIFLADQQVLFENSGSKKWTSKMGKKLIDSFYLELKFQHIFSF